MWQDVKIDIGLFDSGRGGFSLLKKIIEKIPDASYGYVADDKYAPYGEKTETQIIERARVITLKLEKYGAKIIVVACNSATAHAIDILRGEFPHLIFVGIEPYINALHKENLRKSDRIVVVTTHATGVSKRFLDLKERLDPKNIIIHLPLKNLASLVEEAFDGIGADYEERLIKELEKIKKETPTHIILGCTHYPLIKEKIEKFTGAYTIAPCENVARRVVDLVTPFYSDSIHQNDKNFWYLKTSEDIWIKMNYSQLTPPNN